MRHNLYWSHGDAYIIVTVIITIIITIIIIVIIIITMLIENTIRVGENVPTLKYLRNEMQWNNICEERLVTICLITTYLEKNAGLCPSIACNSFHRAFFFIFS